MVTLLTQDAQILTLNLSMMRMDPELLVLIFQMHIISIITDLLVGVDMISHKISCLFQEQNVMLSAKSSYDLSPDVTMNTVVMFSQLDGDTRFAGTPITGPYPTMPSNSPNHPLYALYGAGGTLVPAGAYDPDSKYLQMVSQLTLITSIVLIQMHLHMVMPRFT